ncbi:NB-ARC domain-containing protein [Sinosporangium album]|uniref:NB-ARC domain-containing protein n=1 Tax=Sinosporangium album TaxID=504805 RepID=A0A1G8L481_9ACTN|nr:NB-ARC domain-containing protein [Sinosporangium album]SDI50478.1 NB-ARC domain-containing protein [Sinosporangium album]
MNPSPQTPPAPQNSAAGPIHGLVQAGTVTGGIVIYGAAGPTPPPRQLPPASRAFVNRVTELAELSDALTHAGTAPWCPPAPALVVISGPGGAGKTALAARWAHEISGQFPDGHLYADLRGCSPSPSPAASEIMHRFSRALGATPAQISPDPEDRLALYRTLTSHRSLLIMLDDVASSRQIMPLMPASARSLVVATTRRERLGGLIGQDPHRLTVGPLPETEAIALLERLLGRRVNDERAAAEQLVQDCGGLPHALVAAAAHLSTRERSLTSLAMELAARTRTPERKPVNASRTGTVLDAAYAGLTSQGQRAYRRLAFHPGPRVASMSVQRILDVDAVEALRVTAELRSACLLQQAGGFYTIDTTVQEHARALAEHIDTAQAHAEAIERIVGWLLDAALTADLAAMPDRLRYTDRYQQAHTAGLVFETAADALDWLEETAAEIRAAAALALERGLHPEACAFAEAIRSLALYRRAYPVWDSVTDIALRAAQAMDDPGQLSRSAVARASYLVALRRYTEAADLLGIAVKNARNASDELSEASARQTLGTVYKRLGDDAGTHGRSRHFDEARKEYKAAARIFIAHARDRAVALTWRHAGELDLSARRYGSALEHLHRACDEFTELADTSNIGWTLVRIAETYLRKPSPRLVVAETRLGQAMEIAQAATHRPMQAQILGLLSEVAEARHEYSAAVGYQEQAAALLRELGHPDTVRAEARLRYLRIDPAGSAADPTDV